MVENISVMNIILDLTLELGKGYEKAKQRALDEDNPNGNKWLIKALIYTFAAERVANHFDEVVFMLLGTGEGSIENPEDILKNKTTTQAGKQ